MNILPHLSLSLCTFGKLLEDDWKEVKPSFDMSTNVFIYPFPFRTIWNSDACMYAVCVSYVISKPMSLANSRENGKKKWAKWSCHCTGPASVLTSIHLRGWMFTCTRNMAAYVSCPAEIRVTTELKPSCFLLHRITETLHRKTRDGKMTYHMKALTTKTNDLNFIPKKERTPASCPLSSIRALPSPTI